MVKDKVLDELQDEVESNGLDEVTTSSTDQTETLNDAVYRYYCPACSGTAFQCSSKEYFEGECHACHAALERDENNYIQL